MSHDVEGSIENEKVSWKITRIRKGIYPGQPQSGVLAGDLLKLHFARRNGTGRVVMVCKPWEPSSFRRRSEPHLQSGLSVR